MQATPQAEPLRSPMAGPGDRWSWLWLLAGLALLAFSAWQTIIPLAAWLAPVFLLRFHRTTSHRRLAAPLLFLVYAAAIAFGGRGVVASDPWSLAFSVITTPLLRGVVYVLPYLADDQLGRRLGAWGRLLAFPLAYTSVDWLLSLLRLTNGNVGTLAYSQAGVPPVAQLVSLTGMWGVTFLITWFAALANGLWERRFDWGPLRGQLALFAGVLAAVLGYGAARLLWPAPNAGAPGVRVAAVTMDHTAWSALQPELNWGTFYQYSDAQRSALRPKLAATTDPLLTQTEAALRQGAQIVVWSETAGLVLEEDEPALLAQAAGLAQQYHAEVQLGLGVLTRARSLQYLRNQAILIDAAGTVVWTYDKSYPVFPSEAFLVPNGGGVMPVADQAFGRLGTVICQDIHFPPLLRQAGRGGVELLLDPSSDVSPLGDMDEEVATFRAIENGVTLVRPNGNGPTRVFDAVGRVLVQQDEAAGAGLVLATVPARHAWTLYSQVGDVFAYACVLALMVLAALAFSRRGRPALQARPRAAGRALQP